MPALTQRHRPRNNKLVRYALLAGFCLVLCLPVLLYARRSIQKTPVVTPIETPVRSELPEKTLENKNSQLSEHEIRKIISDVDETSNAGNNIGSDSRNGNHSKSFGGGIRGEIPNSDDNPTSLSGRSSSSGSSSSGSSSSNSNSSSSSGSSSGNNSSVGGSGSRSGTTRSSGSGSSGNYTGGGSNISSIGSSKGNVSIGTIGTPTGSHISSANMPWRGNRAKPEVDLMQEYQAMLKEPPITTVVANGATSMSPKRASRAHTDKGQAAPSLGDEFYRLVQQYASRNRNGSCPSVRHDGMNLEYIDWWAKNKQTVCSKNDTSSSSLASSSSSSPSSTIECYFKSSAPTPMTLCTTTNSQIDVAQLRVDRNFRSGNGAAPKGSLLVNCAADQARAKRSSFPTSTGAWMIDALRDNATLQCDHWVEHPVFFISRWRVTNPFHILEDLTQTFVSLMVARDVLREHGHKLEIVFADDMLEGGPFFPAWDALFTMSNRTDVATAPTTPSQTPQPSSLQSGSNQAKKKSTKKKKKKKKTSAPTSSDNSSSITSSDRSAASSSGGSVTKHSSIVSDAQGVSLNIFPPNTTPLVISASSSSPSAASLVSGDNISAANSLPFSLSYSDRLASSTDTTPAKTVEIDAQPATASNKNKFAKERGVRSKFAGIAETDNDSTSTAESLQSTRSRSRLEGEEAESNAQQNALTPLTGVGQVASVTEGNMQAGTEEVESKPQTRSFVDAPASANPSRAKEEADDNAQTGSLTATSAIANPSETKELESGNPFGAESNTQTKPFDSPATASPIIYPPKVRTAEHDTQIPQQGSTEPALGVKSEKKAKTNLTSSEAAAVRMRAYVELHKEYHHKVGEAPIPVDIGFGGISDFGGGGEEVSEADAAVAAEDAQAFQEGHVTQDKESLSPEHWGHLAAIDQAQSQSSSSSSSLSLSSAGGSVGRRLQATNLSAIFSAALLTRNSSSSSSSSSAQASKTPARSNTTRPLRNSSKAVPPPSLLINELPYPPNTCFRRTLHSVHGGVSLLSMFGVGELYSCHSSILQAFSHWMLQSFDLPTPCEGLRPLRLAGKKVGFEDFSTRCGEPPVEDSERPVRITVISRMQFLHEPGGKLRQLTHGTLSQEVEKNLFGTLSEILLAAPRPIVVRRARFELLSLREQLKLATETDILVGMHGAALAFSLFLPASASVIELYTRDRGVQNQHYRNLNFWTQRRYQALDIDATDGTSLKQAHLDMIAAAINTTVDAYL